MKLITILKSKIKNKSKITDEWYLKRLEICNKCEYNSKNYNKDKGIWYWMWNILNLKKPFCTICGCEVAAKASVEFEECSLPEINKEPKWTKII